jgi:hypothetical protein
MPREKEMKSLKHLIEKIAIIQRLEIKGIYASSKSMHQMPGDIHWHSRPW